MKLESAQGFRLMRNFSWRTAAAAGLLFAACDNPSEKSSTQTPTPILKDLPEEPERVLPFEGLNFLSVGPHTATNSSEGILNSLDFTPEEVTHCNAGDVLAEDEQEVVAVVSGEIVIRGITDNRSDRNHSIVGIKEQGTGETFLEVHLIPNADLNIGDIVKAGDPIGKASCEFPPSGSTNGINVHVTRVNGPIEGLTFSNWKVQVESMVYIDGTVRNDDTRRCYDDNQCDGKRNDLRIEDDIESSLKPTPPVPVIRPTPVGNTPIITIKPTEILTPEPSISVETSPPIEIEDPWHDFTSIIYNYSLEYPNNWYTNTGQYELGSNYVVEYFRGEAINSSDINVSVVAIDIDETFGVNNYIEWLLKENNGIRLEPVDNPSPEQIPQNNLTGIQVGGYSTDYLNLPVPNGYEINYYKTVAIFIKEFKLFQVTLLYGDTVMPENLSILYDQFTHMLRTFEFVE